MNISDKKFIEFAEKIWDRNKELIEENRALKRSSMNDQDRIYELKRELDFEKSFSRDAHVQRIKLKKELEETNEEYNQIVDELMERIKELEKDRTPRYILDDWGELFEEDECDSEPANYYINCTFNVKD